MTECRWKLVGMCLHPDRVGMSSELIVCIWLNNCAWQALPVGGGDAFIRNPDGTGTKLERSPRNAVFRSTIEVKPIRLN